MVQGPPFLNLSLCFPGTSLRATGLPLVRPPGQAERHRGGDAHDLALDLDQLPPTLVDHAVMALAEQDRVLEVGLPAVDPVHQVMAVAPGSRTLAARPLAVLVAHRQGLAQAAVDQAPGAADVD